MVAVGDPILLATMPGNTVAVTVASADSATFTTTETVVMTVTAPLVDGVTYWVIANAAFEVVSANSTLRAALREDTVSGTLMAASDQTLITTAAATLDRTHLVARYTATATGSKTFVLTGDLTSGAGTANLNANSTIRSWLYVIVAA